MTLPHVPDATRRALLVTAHRLDRGGGDVLGLAHELVAIHSSDPATPHLAAWARLGAEGPAQLDRALYGERTLWRRHAMRRTLFVVPTATAGIVHAAAGHDVARAERRRLLGLLAEVDGAVDGGWLAGVEGRTLAVLDAGGEWTTRAITEAVEELTTPLAVGSGRWKRTTTLASRLLLVLALEGRIVRTRPAGSFRSSQYRWASPAWWFGHEVEHGHDPAWARAQLARRYLSTHAPATLTDLRWWTGWTAARTRAALRDVEAVEVGLDDGSVGLLLPEQLEAALEAGPEPDDHVVALLPALDPTPMGFQERGWFLGPHGPALFDRNGNAGPTVWVDGRTVGGWGQRPDGEVVVRLLEDVGRPARRLVDERAGELTAWLDGTVVVPRFRSPLERELSG